MPIYTNEVSQISHFYETFGHGTTRVVMVMGLFGMHSAWEFQKKYFENSKDYEILVFDNRGVGQSSAPAGRYTTTMMAQDTVGLLDGLGWGKVHVCGISMGGMISQELALLLGEERCLSLTLLATHAGGWLNKFPPIKGAKHFLKALTFDSKTDTEDVVENAIQMLYGSNTLNDPVSMELAREYHTRMIQIKKDFPITRNGMTGQMAAVASHGVTADRLRKIGAMKFKKLVVVGTEDNLVRHTNSKYIADHIGATYVEVQGHGHVITISYRDELNPLLDELWGGKGRFADTP